MTKPTKEEVQTALDIATDADLPDGAYWAMVHDQLGLEYGDVFPLILEYGLDDEETGEAPDLSDPIDKIIDTALTLTDDDAGQAAATVTLAAARLTATLGIPLDEVLEIVRRQYEAVDVAEEEAGEGDD